MREDEFAMAKMNIENSQGTNTLVTKLPAKGDRDNMASKSGGLAAVARRIYRSDRKLQLMLLVLMLLCYGGLLGISWRLLLWGDPMNLTFNSMFSHLMHGQFDVDPQIVGWEGFVRNGRVYAYWGIWCALLRFPLWIFHRMNVDMTVFSCLAAACLAAMTKIRAALLIRRHKVQSPVAGAAIGLMLAYILFGGSGTGYLAVNIYHEVVLWAAAFGALFVYFAVKSFVGGAFDDKTLRWMALWAGLALLTRVSTGIGLILALSLLLIVLAGQEAGAAANEDRPFLWRFGKALIRRRTLIPSGIVAALIAATGAVNYFRWGNPATFADYYVYICNKCVGDWVPRLHEYGLFNIRRIPFGLAYFFFPVWVLRGSDGRFFLGDMQSRLLNTVELPPSSLLLTDLLPLCFIVLLAIAIWRRRSGSLSSMSRAAAIAIGLLAPGILMMMASTMAYRFRMEFYPEIDFLAFLGLYLTVTDEILLAKFARFRRWIAGALAISILASLASLALYDLGGGSTPRDFTDGIATYYRKCAALVYHRTMVHYFAPHQ